MSAHERPGMSGWVSLTMAVTALAIELTLFVVLVMCAVRLYSVFWPHR
jgi:hypothetical protein